MTKLKMLLAGIAVLASACLANAQQAAFPNYPIVGSAAYCAVLTNNACTQTIPAGPSVLTGTEQFPANTGLAGNRQPQSVLVTAASLNALPVTFTSVTFTTSPATFISASSVSGGAFFSSTAVISNMTVGLPAGPIDGQQFVISANRTITTLLVTSGAAAQSIAANSAPSVLTASLTAPQGYTFVFNSSTNQWFRLR